MNLLLTNITLGLIATCFLLAAPPLLLGCYVYYRGRREERSINADLQAELIDKKINILCNHRDAVNFRYQNNVSYHTPEKNFLHNAPAIKPKPSKEKRGIIGNPISHFMGSSLATMGLLSCTVIKWGVLAAFIIGGPVAWIIAGVISVGIGGYFGYKRYKHLTAKITMENQMAAIVVQEAQINHLKRNAELALTKSTTIDPKSISTPIIKLRPQPPVKETKSLIDVSAQNTLQSPKNKSVTPPNTRRNSLPGIRLFHPTPQLNSASFSSQEPPAAMVNYGSISLP